MAEPTTPESKPETTPTVASVADASSSAPTPTSTPPPEAGNLDATHPKKDDTKIDPQLALGAKQRAKVATQKLKLYFTKKGTIWSDLPQMFASLLSGDRPTRRMAALFFLSLSGLILVSSIAIHRYWEAKKKTLLAEAQRHAKHLSELIKKETEEARRRASLVSLGKYTIELKEMVEQTLGLNQLNTAEVEIVILCDGKETREYIESHMVYVRNQMTNVLIAMDREELTSREGKKRIKMLITRRLNEWLPHGKVEDIYFSKLITY
jgi:flagellar basal body-associated protein FliL